MNLFGLGKKKKVLKPCVVVADDVPTIRAIVRGICTEMGFLTYEAWNGNDALETARKHSPELVILDLNMQQMDGLTATKAFREDPELASIPIIILSGSKDEETIRRAKEAGATDFIIKDGLESVAGNLRRHLSEIVAGRDAT